MSDQPTGPTNPPVDPETSAPARDKSLQAREPAEPASSPREESVASGTGAGTGGAGTGDGRGAAGAAAAETDAAETDAAEEAAGAEQPVEPSAHDEAHAQETIAHGEHSEQATLVDSFEVTLRIRRFNPELDEEPHWREHRVTVQGTDRLLDALHKVKWEEDGTLTFRRSCAHGVCGSDAMRINGKNRLACKTLVKDVNPDKPIVVEPIKGLPVLKDLVVDMEPFFDAYRSVMPFLVTTGHEPTRERLQSQEDRERFDDTTKCILCAACTTSCPVYWTDGQYFGPQAIVGAHRFIFDSRDEGAAERLEILNDREGVWRCRTTFNCTEACPRGIEVTKAIQEVKRALVFRR